MQSKLEPESSVLTHLKLSPPGLSSKLTASPKHLLHRNSRAAHALLCVLQLQPWLKSSLPHDLDSQIAFLPPSNPQSSPPPTCVIDTTD